MVLNYKYTKEQCVQTKGASQSPLLVTTAMQIDKITWILHMKVLKMFPIKLFGTGTSFSFPNPDFLTIQNHRV